MMGLLFLFGLFLFAGLFFLAAAFLQLPGTRVTRAMLGTVRQEKKNGEKPGSLSDVHIRTSGKIYQDRGI